VLDQRNAPAEAISELGDQMREAFEALPEGLKHYHTRRQHAADWLEIASACVGWPPTKCVTGSMKFVGSRWVRARMESLTNRRDETTLSEACRRASFAWPSCETTRTRRLSCFWAEANKRYSEKHRISRFVHMIRMGPAPRNFPSTTESMRGQIHRQRVN
jgi:hypothetical protein